MFMCSTSWATHMGRGSRMRHYTPQSESRQRIVDRRFSATASLTLSSVRAAMADGVPTVDMAELRSGDAGARQRVAAACRDWGFFQVVNHGVSMEFVQKIRKQFLDLFALPPEQKDAVSRTRGGGLYGYHFRPNHGPLEVFQANTWDHEQLLNFANQLFPDSSEELLSMYEEAKVVFRALAIEILDIMIQGLGVDAKHFQAHKEESVVVMRANYYHKGSEHVLGLPPHVDGNILTILHQQDVSGLEVLKDGRWVAIQPQTHAFCINVGDMMQVLSNGQYRSIQHRAISSTTAARLSVAYFLTPGPAATVIQAAPELGPALYRPFTWADFAQAGQSLRDQGWSDPSYLPHFQHHQDFSPQTREGEVP